MTDLLILPPPRRRTTGEENCYRLQIAALAGRLDYRERSPWLFDVWVDSTRPVLFVPTTGRVGGTTQRGWSALCAVLDIPLR